MSRFFTKRLEKLTPYTPGEQPRDMQYIKLNTNESPFPPSPAVVEAAKAEAGRLQLYSDPTCRELTDKLASLYGVTPEQVILTNGSDEVLNFAFTAFSDESHPITFADITYGFYSVFAELNRVPYVIKPLKDDFTIDIDDYCGNCGTVFIANPNAPTGILLSLDEIEKIVKSNPDNVVVIDEAYIDFGGESAYPLTAKYDNLIVVRTFSKSRSMAGARLGYALGPAALIADLEKIKFSVNPYNVNRLTLRLGEATVDAESYYQEKCAAIIRTREETAEKLRNMGFEVLPSKTNFLFVKNDKIGGRELYEKLKDRGILVRHFSNRKIRQFNRITVGTPEQMKILIETLKEILKS